MKKINILLIISIVFFFLSIVLLFMDYFENQAEMIFLFYWPLGSKDISMVESILKEEGMEKENDYTLMTVPIKNPEIKVKELQYIKIRTDKICKALTALLNSGKEFRIINNSVPITGTYSLGERGLNDNPDLLNVFLRIKGIKRCAFDYDDRKEGLFGFEEESGKAIVIIELEKGFLPDKNLLNGIVQLTAGCNVSNFYERFVSSENVIVCNPEGKVLFGNEKPGEGFLEEERFSRVKENLTDKEVKPEIIRFSSRKVKIAVVFLTLSVIGLFWYFIKEK